MMRRAAFGLMILKVILISSLGFLLYGCKLENPVIRDNEIGVYGPMKIAFSESKNIGSVKEQFSVEIRGETNDQSKFMGDIKWEDNELVLFPHLAMKPGCSYSVNIDTDFQDETGNQNFYQLNYRFNTRQPSILFMSPADQNAQLWRVSIFGDDPLQITRQIYGIYDYAVSRSGNWIAFSAHNQEGGKDIWRVDRDGKKETELINCENEWCIQPAISIDDEKIAYTKIPEQYIPQKENNNVDNIAGSQIWIYDQVTGKNEIMINHIYENGYRYETMPSFSPDGTRVAFYLKLNDKQGIAIFNLSTDSLDQFFPSMIESPGSWSDDGTHLLFMDMQLTSRSQPINLLYEVDMKTLEFQIISHQGLEGMDFNLPIYSHDKEWLLLSEQLIEGAFNKQITLRNLEEGNLITITDDLQYNNAAYKWEPGGYGLVFQRFSNTSSETLPQVVLWTNSTAGEMVNCDESDKKEIEKIKRNDIFRIMAVDAALPTWIP